MYVCVYTYVCVCVKRQGQDDSVNPFYVHFHTINQTLPPIEALTNNATPDCNVTKHLQSISWYESD